MKRTTFVMKWFTFFSQTFFTSTECTKVFDSFWDNITVETHNNSFRLALTNFNIKKDTVRHFWTVGINMIVVREGRKKRRRKKKENKMKIN